MSSCRRRSSTPVDDDSGPSARPRIWLKPKADGSGFTLEPSSTVLSISRKAYFGRMTACWPKWTMIPDDVKEAIWQEFLGKVDLQDADVSVVHRHWSSKIAKNYRETLNAAKSAGKRPYWMSEVVWDQFQVWWNNDEFMRSSERNSANRSSNPNTHRGGSKSFQHHREDLEKIRGRPVSYWEVFVHTHAESEVDDSGAVSLNWGVNEKARVSYDKFIQARATMLDDTERDDLTTDEEDAIFESIMDPPIRGRRYGFGNQAARTSQQAFEKAQDKEEIAQLRAEVNELRERDSRREKMLEELQQKWETFVQTYGHNPSSGSGND